MMFSINVLLYGDYPVLASRVLHSLLGSPEHLVQDMRIGLNSVSPQTSDIVHDFCSRRFLQAPCYVYESEQNVGKYPLMRRMFHDVARPLASRIMWFDDDSYLDSTVDAAWWDILTSELGSCAMLGVPHYIRPRGNQIQAVRRQPWYTGQPLTDKSMFYFITGGWWAGRSDFLISNDYPFAELYHNGGDSILGELCRQQKLELARFSRAVCYCGSPGCVARLATVPAAGRVHVNFFDRRGIGAKRRDEVYVWQNWRDDQVSFEHLARHQFSCRVYSYRTPQIEVSDAI